MSSLRVMPASFDKIAAYYIAPRRRRFRVVLGAAIAVTVLLLRFNYYPSLKDDSSSGGNSIVVDHSTQSAENREISYSQIISRSRKFNADDVDWSRVAYTQYVTDSEYLCNSVMLFQRLHWLDSRPDRVLMYPAKMLWDPAAPDGGGSRDADLLIKARDEYSVKLVPIKVQHRETEDGTWADSYTKLLAFNQTRYERVLSLDSDTTILQHMDELFFAPPCPIAMPRAYWLPDDEATKQKNRTLASHIMLITPSKKEFARIMSQVAVAGDDEYDMEIVNRLYRDSALVLPHRPYGMLTSEFRSKDHRAYLGSDGGEWDPQAVYREAKAVHFSDYPVPKPWVAMDDEVRREMQPECKTRKGSGEEDCTDRKMWNGFYADFSERKQLLCPEKPVSKYQQKPWPIVNPN